jgi:phosphate starvation-inducible PhoH-like protein
MAPWTRPIFDVFEEHFNLKEIEYMLEMGKIEVAPLAYMRGRTLNNAFILLDEAQNTTPMQIKMFLTRMGPNSKVIITGDTSQIDLPKRQKSGLIESIGILKDVEGIGIIELSGKDVVRHKLVKEIISAYDKFDKSQE